MALTLAEAAKTERNPLRAGIIEVFARSSPVMTFGVFQQIVGNAYSYNLEGKLPGISFRGINEAYPESTGVVNPQTESMAIAGGDSDVDKALQKSRPASSIGDLRATYDAMKVKAFSGFITREFFRGDHASNPRGFDGMEKRLTGTQLITAAAPSAGGDELTLDLLDELIDAVDGPTVLYMNRRMRRKVNKLVRAAGQARETVSVDFGMQMDAYAGIPIGVIEEDHEGNDILAFNEDSPGGGASVSTSIYAVRWEADMYTSMLESAPGLEVSDLGELQEKPAFRTRVEWMITPAVFNKRGAARLQGINNTF